MRIIPKLNLNQNPQNCEEGSLVFAKNMKLDFDGSLTSDFGYNNIDGLEESNTVGHIVGLDNKIYFFTHDVDSNNNVTDSIYEYDEIERIYNRISANWTYSGGEIDGCVSTNISGEKILTIAEYNKTGNTEIPLKHINLSFSKNSDDESLYTQAPKVPMCNLTLNTTYAKTIPNGTYVFFIRYKIRKDCYTNWYLCSNPIFGGTSTKITTLQGGVNYIDTNTDSAKSFVFDISFINDSFKSLYKSFQLGFIISHDDATNARSWKEFEMNTNKIYFDYENVEEINIDDILATTYEIYNVRNITNFKNKLYISNYKESNINDNTEDLTRNISINYKHSDHDGVGDVIYKNLKLNGNSLKYDELKGYYDLEYAGDNYEKFPKKEDLYYDVSDFYKGDTLEKDRLASFNIKWDSNNDPDLCTVYNIFNDAYNSAIFGKTEERLYNKGIIGIIEKSQKDGIWTYDIDSSKPHQWYNLGFTFSYGSTEEKDQESLIDARNGVFLFNFNTRYRDGIEGRISYWYTRNKGFSDEARSFIIKNIKDEIEAKNRLIYCYIELSYGTNTYPIRFDSIMNKDSFIGETNAINYGFENANTTNINNEIKDKIITEVYRSITEKAIGLDENGALLFYLNEEIVRISSATVVFKSIKFSVDVEDIEDTDTVFSKRFTISAKITEWKSICNFNIKEQCLNIDDSARDSIIQKPTLMPWSTYKVYAHYVDDKHIITNGSFVKTIITDAATSNTDTINLVYRINSNPPIGTKYKGLFFSIINVGDYVIECFNYRKKDNIHIVNCIEVDSLLYNINTNITIIDSNGDLITENAKYYSSGSSYPILAFGNCGYIAWEDDSISHSNKKLYVIISRDTSNEKNHNLIKCSPYIELKQCEDTTLYNGFYDSYFCLVKKPDFDLASTCYVSGRDIYNVERKASLRLKDFNGYVQIQNSVTYFIRSNFNLNYLSLTEDINDQIFSIGSASSGLKQVAKVINSATLSYIYELKNMYKDFRNKTFKAYDDTTKTDFDNTIRVSNVLSDETFNNSVFKFSATDYYNIPTDRGIIVKLFSIANNIFVHTKGSLYKFDANQTLIANNADISLAESEPFETGITQIFDSQYGYAGIDNKHSGCITFDSYVFYDKQNNHIFAYSGNSQISIVDSDIYKILDYYKPIDCIIIHDEKNSRVLLNFVIPTNKEITISFNYKQKAFVSLHDITLNKAFNSRNICYSYNNQLCSLFETSSIIPPNIYGGATKDSYLTDAPEEETYKNCRFSISVILFPADNTQRASVDSVQYVADLVKTNIIKNTTETKNIMYISRNTKINPVKEFFIITDECHSTSVITTVDDTSRPNNLLDYKGFKYNLGFWSCNYFRNRINIGNVYDYPNQPGIEYNSDGTVKQQRIPNTDNYSLVYGKYFILTFGFINDKPIKFENVLINNSLY